MDDIRTKMNSLLNGHKEEVQQTVLPEDVETKHWFYYARVAGYEVTGTNSNPFFDFEDVKKHLKEKYKDSSPFIVSFQEISLETKRSFGKTCDKE